MNLALIGGGVVGQTYGKALASQGMRLCGLWDSRPTPALEAFARDHDTQVHADAGGWLAHADVVVSAVFGTAALDVASQALPQMRQGALFIDMTTADPDDMAQADRCARERGCDFVDVAITGAVNLTGQRTPLLCAGTRAAAVAEMFQAVGARVQVVGDRPGDAASLKLLRSIFTKGLEALSVECLVTAERRGLRARLHEILSDIDQGTLRVLMESMAVTHIEHSARRHKEVIEAQRQMVQAGIRPLVMPAVEALFERTTRHQALRPHSGQGIESALAWLAASSTLDTSPPEPAPA